MSDPDRVKRSAAVSSTSLALPATDPPVTCALRSRGFVRALNDRIHRMSAEWKLGARGLVLIAFAAIAALVAGACGSSPSGRGTPGRTPTAAGLERWGAPAADSAEGAAAGLGGVNDDSGSASSSGGGSGGPTTCDPSCAAAGGTCNSGTCVISENPGRAVERQSRLARRRRHCGQRLRLGVFLY